jgi:hypothetical protein
MTLAIAQGVVDGLVRWRRRDGISARHGPYIQ